MLVAYLKLLNSTLLQSDSCQFAYTVRNYPYKWRGFMDRRPNKILLELSNPVSWGEMLELFFSETVSEFKETRWLSLELQVEFP